MTFSTTNTCFSSSFYDFSGERAIKIRSSGRLVYVNGQLVQSLSGVHDNFTTYVSPEYIVDNEYTYTKFVYMGSRRITAKVCDGSAETPAKSDPRGNEPNTDYENLQFFFHSDHLGSTSYMTDLSGEVSQHVDYFPYGGIMTEERTSGTENPYLFNGKELDQETGLYYYGARYIEPDGSMWYGVDPLAEKYPGISPYCYTLGNPIMFVDPDGRKVWPINKTYKGHGRKHENNYSVSRPNGRKHAGIDINHTGGGNTDLGAPIVATHDGTITRAVNVNKDRNDKNEGGNRVQILS